jgi:hypothetical protein
MFILNNFTIVFYISYSNIKVPEFILPQHNPPSVFWTSVRRPMETALIFRLCVQMHVWIEAGQRVS